MRYGLAITVALSLAWAGTTKAQTARPADGRTIQRTQYVDPAAPPPTPGPSSPVPRTSPYGGAPLAAGEASGTAYEPSGGVFTQPLTGAQMVAPPYQYNGSYSDYGEGSALASDFTDVLGTRFYSSVEYLIIWPKRANLPASVTAFPTTARTDEISGILQLRTIDPDQAFPVQGGVKQGTPSGGFSGIRVTLGGWVDQHQQTGLEAVYMNVPDRGRSVLVNPGAASPFVVARSAANITEANSSILLTVSETGVLTGGVTTATTFGMEGIEGNLRYRGPQFLSERFDWLVGFRYLRIDESVQISDSATAVNDEGVGALGGPPAVIGSTLSTFDSFVARNEFYGPQVGAHARYGFCNNRVMFDAMLKLAFGVIAENVNISGNTTLTRPGDTTLRAPQGFLTGPNNIGNFYETRWVVIPELNFNGSYRFNQNLSAFVGFNTLFIQQIQRAASTIDPFIDPTALPFRGNLFTANLNAPRPAFRFDNESFWIYGINLGLQYTY